MAGRRTSFKIPGLTAWVDNIKNELSQETAREIVKDLQFLGPWYSGEFAKNWVVKSGQTSVGATKERTAFFRLPPGETTTKPGGRNAMPGPSKRSTSCARSQVDLLYDRQPDEVSQHCAGLSAWPLFPQQAKHSRPGLVRPLR